MLPNERHAPPDRLLGLRRRRVVVAVRHGPKHHQDLAGRPRRMPRLPPQHHQQAPAAPPEQAPAVSVNMLHLPGVGWRPPGHAGGGRAPCREPSVSRRPITDSLTPVPGRCRHSRLRAPYRPSSPDRHCVPLDERLATRLQADCGRQLGRRPARPQEDGSLAVIERRARRESHCPHELGQQEPRSVGAHSRPANHLDLRVRRLHSVARSEHRRSR